MIMLFNRLGKSVVLASLFIAILFQTAYANDDISISISLDRDKVGQEENATLTVVVETRIQQGLPKPKLPPTPQFDVYSIGTSSQMLQDGSGIKKIFTYKYALSPKKTGTFPLRSAWLVYNNKRYESNHLQLHVVKNAREASGPLAEISVDGKSKQKELFLVTETNKKTAYVNEQVVFTRKFFIMSRIRAYSPPNYWPLSAPDFWISDSTQEKQYRQVINGYEYWVREQSYALFATKPGKLTINSIRLAIAVAQKSKRHQRDPFSLIEDLLVEVKKVTVKSQPITVQVKSLPKKGRPAKFSGAIGQYRLTAGVDRTNVEVNESITLMVKISGTGNIKSIPEPTLPDMDGFRFEKSSTNFKQLNIGKDLGGTKTFEYLLLPRISGTQTIKPLTLNFFDPVKGKYRSTQSKPIILNVNQGELSADTEIPYNPVSGQTINLKETDIRFIKTSGSTLIPSGSIALKSPVFLAVVGLPILVLIGGFIDVRRKRKLAGNVAYARLRKAKSIAQKRLKLAEEYLVKNDDAFYAEVSGVIYQFIADKLNHSAQGLTSEAVDELLEECNASVDLRSDIKNVLREADFGRFAGSGEGESGKQDLYNRAESIISNLEETL
ncbi:MAG: protein BatD [candidate division Zixibacteria bacterium]|nr:protein BatD [candidate division Zixibacteria bacterium]